jgi:polyisoprenoid-binding protein YceI
MTKNLLLTLVGCVTLTMPVAAQSETWQLDPPHSAAQFSVRHMGISTIRGTFTKVSGTVQYDPSDPAKSSIDVSIDPASVDSRVEMRDNDLRSDHFLDVQKYPTLTFKSKRIESAGASKLKATGDLTIHGVTKEDVLNIDGPSQPLKDPRGKMHMGASATTRINRTEFGITGSQGMVGNDIMITIDVELVKPPREAAK